MLEHPQLLGFNRRHRPNSLPHLPVLKQPPVGAGLVVASTGEMNRDGRRRLATAEHHAAARRAGSVRCGSAAPAPPALGRHAAALCVLRSAARSPEHVIAAPTSLRCTVAPLSDPHGTARPGRVGAAVGAGEASPSSIAERSPCVSATLPRQRNGSFSTASCSPATVRSATSASPTRGQKSNAVTGLLCRSGLPRRQHAGTIGPFGRGSRTDA